MLQVLGVLSLVIGYFCSMFLLLDVFRKLKTYQVFIIQIIGYLIESNCLDGPNSSYNSTISLLAWGILLPTAFIILDRIICKIDGDKPL